MRILLFTGKGGVGKTTLAAGTAALAASHGARTLVLSTDAAHSLGDAVGVALPSGEPVEVAPNLWVQHIDVRHRLEQAWRGIQDYLLAVLDSAGVDPLEAEELTVLPGAEEVLALLEVRDRARSGNYDAVVVDCAPTAETLRLLALPEALGWYMDRIWPTERRILRALRPVLGRAAGMPMPHDPVLDAVERLHAELGDVRALLTSPETTVRLVLTPESVVVAESRRTLTALSLYGYRVDAAIANRLVPAGDDPWRSAWAQAQALRLVEIGADIAPLPLLTVPYTAGEPVGIGQLRDLAGTVYTGRQPLAVLADAPVMTVQRAGDGYVLELPLPLADRGDLDVARRGDELLVTLGGQRRVLALPSALRRCILQGAGLRDGILRVRFIPDPDLWRRP